MKKFKTYLSALKNKKVSIVLVTGFFSCFTWAEPIKAQEITRKSQLEFVNALPEHFSGKVTFARYPNVPVSSNISVATVHFEKGARTNWHTHPEGQYLIVTEGEGLTQEWGKPIQEIHEGDMVWCPPNVKHWHGANINSSMSHIALTPISSKNKTVIWSDETNTMTRPQLSLIQISALSTVGNLEELKSALINGLDSGLTVNQIKEVFAHQSAYIGFPRALNGTLTFKKLLEDRKHQGIKDIEGAMPTTMPEDTDYYQLGVKQLSLLTQKSVSESQKPLFDNFSPTMDFALKAHLFGYLFSKDNLTALDRELIVISTLSSLGGVEAQLNSHLKIIYNLGLKQDQLQLIVDTLQQTVGNKAATTLQEISNSNRVEK